MGLGLKIENWRFFGAFCFFQRKLAPKVALSGGTGGAFTVKKSGHPVSGFGGLT